MKLEIIKRLVIIIMNGVLMIGINLSIWNGVQYLWLVVINGKDELNKIKQYIIRRKNYYLLLIIIRLS